MIVPDVSRILDADKRRVYLCTRDVLLMAAGEHGGTRPCVDRAIDACEHALASGPSTEDARAWRLFVERLADVIATLEAGPLDKLRGGWVAVLKRIVAENRDLIEPATPETGEQTSLR